MGSWGSKSTWGGRSDAFGKADDKTRVCKTCGARFMKKHWVHSADTKKTSGKDAKIAFTECPACRMKHDHTFEGEILMRSFEKTQKKEILRLIKNIGERAYLRDPMDRILETEDLGERMRITTSENQLALRMGKKIKSVFKGDLVIHWSKEDEVVRITWEGPATK